MYPFKSYLLIWNKRFDQTQKPSFLLLVIIEGLDGGGGGSGIHYSLKI